LHYDLLAYVGIADPNPNVKVRCARILYSYLTE